MDRLQVKAASDLLLTLELSEEEFYEQNCLVWLHKLKTKGRKIVSLLADKDIKPKHQ